VALGARLLYLWNLSSSPLFPLVMGDGEVYDQWARGLAAGDWLGKGVFYQAPLYPYLLGMVYALFGPSLLAVRLVQALLGSFACLFLARAGALLLGRRAGLAAGILLALYPPALFADGLIQKSSLDLFLVSLLLMLVASITASSRQLWCGIGCVLGCLVLTRENALLLVAVCLTWALVSGRTARGKAVAAALLVAGLATVLMPVGLRNLAVGGEFHLTTSQLGPNFYIGNNPSATGIYVPLVPGHGSALDEAMDARLLAERAVGRSLTAGEVSGYWLDKAGEYIRKDPGDWLRLLGRKFLLLWNRVEVSDTEDLDTYGDYSLLLRTLLPLLNFGTVLPLAVLGGVLAGRSPRLLILYGLAAAYSLSVVVFYVFARYRLPLVPILLIFAGAGLERLLAPETWRKAWPHLGAALAAAAAAAVLANWPLLPERAVSSRAVTLNNIGVALGKRGAEPGEILGYFRDAARLDGLYAQPNKNAGIVLYRMGRPREALEYFTVAARLDPGDAEVFEDAGICLNDLGSFEEAASRFRRALALDAGRANSHYGLGVVLSRLGRETEAAPHLETARRLNPRLGVPRR
jgi:tetratricopeptide (TPR) repeat protein